MVENKPCDHGEDWNFSKERGSVFCEDNGATRYTAIAAALW